MSSLYLQYLRWWKWARSAAELRKEIKNTMTMIKMKNVVTTMMMMMMTMVRTAMMNDDEEEEAYDDD